VIFFDTRLSASGAHGAMLSEDGQLWRLDRDPTPVMRQLAAHPDMVSVAVSGDGSQVYVGRRGDVLDGTTGELRQTVPVPGQAVLDLAVSPDDRWVAAGTLAGEVWVWSREDWQLRAIGKGHEGRVAAVDFDPTSAVLVTGSWDGTAMRWGLGPLDTSADDLVSQAETAWGMSLEDALGAEVR